MFPSHVFTNTGNHVYVREKLVRIMGFPVERKRARQFCLELKHFGEKMDRKVAACFGKIQCVQPKVEHIGMKSCRDTVDLAKINCSFWSSFEKWVNPVCTPREGWRGDCDSNYNRGKSTFST